MVIKDIEAEESLREIQRENPEVAATVLKVLDEWRTPLEVAAITKLKFGKVARVLHLLSRTEKLEMRHLSVNADGSPAVRYRRVGVENCAKPTTTKTETLLARRSPHHGVIA